MRQNLKLTSYNLKEGEIYIFRRLTRFTVIKIKSDLGLDSIRIHLIFISRPEAKHSIIYIILRWWSDYARLAWLSV